MSINVFNTDKKEFSTHAHKRSAEDKNTSPLSGFKAFDPKDDYNAESPYKLSVSKDLIVISNACYRNFKGDQYLRIEYKEKPKEIALIKSDHKDPLATQIARQNGRNAYRRYYGKATVEKLHKLLAPLSFNGNRRYRIRADIKDVYPNFIIFRADKDHVSQTNKPK